MYLIWQVINCVWTNVNILENISVSIVIVNLSSLESICDQDYY